MWYSIASETAKRVKEYTDKELSQSPSLLDTYQTIANQEISASAVEILSQSAPRLYKYYPGLELFQSVLRNPSEIQNYFVYEYHFIDCPEIMISADEVLGGTENYELISKEISTLFKTKGWEGDGQIRVMWIPPFIGPGVEDTFGFVIWFVKQGNNGTSFIASPIPLNFQRLLTQQHYE